MITILCSLLLSPHSAAPVLIIDQSLCQPHHRNVVTNNLTVNHLQSGLESNDEVSVWGVPVGPVWTISSSISHDDYHGTGPAPASPVIT